MDSPGKKESSYVDVIQNGGIFVFFTVGSYIIISTSFADRQWSEGFGEFFGLVFRLGISLPSLCAGLLGTILLRGASVKTKKIFLYSSAIIVLLLPTIISKTKVTTNQKKIINMLSYTTSIAGCSSIYLSENYYDLDHSKWQECVQKFLSKWEEIETCKHGTNYDIQFGVGYCDQVAREKGLYK